MQKYDIKISIIVPIYNTEMYISSCIESIINQTYKNFELLLINDGSTDNSINICKRYETKDRRIKIIQQKNGGAAKARNTGIKVATGDYILFIDSDDYWDDFNFLEKVIKNLIESDADVLNFGYKKYFEDTNLSQMARYNFDREYIDYNDKKISLNYLTKYNLFLSSPCNKAIKRKLLLENNILFNTGKTSEDIDWNARLIIFGKRFDVLNEHSYIYRQRDGSVTHSLTEKSIKDLYKNINTCIQYSNLYNLKYTNFFYEYMSYVAYQYITLLVAIQISKVKLEKNFIRKIKEDSYILKYNINYRVHIFYIINKYFGFSVLNQVIKLFLKIK